MPKKSPNKCLDNPKQLKFHQIGSPDVQRSKSSPTDRRVLILATPIKLNDGTMKMEQRTIPLKVDNGQLTITATENKNNIVSLKRRIEPSPVALPITQLNTKSPTFVKNEVGQVMGKIIPLGKLSDITGNNLTPINAAPPSTVSSLAFKRHFPKPGIKKLIKLEKDDQGDEKLKGALRSIRKPATGTPQFVTVPKVEKIIKSENTDKDVITIADEKPKKRIHLVWKGGNNTLVGVSQTGTKIKLVPLDDWKRKSDGKVNVLPVSTNSGSIQRQKTVGETRKPGNKGLDGIKVERNDDKGDSDVQEIPAKDPLDMSNEEIARGSDTEKRDVDLKQVLEYAKTPHWVHKIRAIDTNSESSGSNSPKITSVAKAMRVELKLARETKPDSILPDRTEASIESDTIEAAKNTANDDPIIVKKELEEFDLYKRFGIDKDNMTESETAMLSYICNLKKKLARSQKSRIQAVTALEQREYLGVTNLSNVQKRFIETQLRNSGRSRKRQRFIKADVLMARDILKTTGPRGYTNLRKIFALPDMSSVKRFSK